MIFNLNESPKTINLTDYDVCICGAGVAGITLAILFARNGKKIALFEGGDIEFTEQSDDIYKGSSTGETYEGLQACRLRYLGGTSNHWSGRCRPFDDVDFIERSFFELPGWPIQKNELDYYEKDALQIVDIADGFKAPELIDWKSESFYSDPYALSPPTRFGKKYYPEIEASEKISLFINANLTDIKLNNSSTNITHLVIKNYQQESYNFSGSSYIMAMGAIENARILLNCNSQLKQGIGNHSDFLGRCFMEHYNINLGRFVGNKKYLEVNKSVGFYTNSQFSIKQQIGNGNIALTVNPDPPIFGRTKDIKKAIRNEICASEQLTAISRKFVDFNCPGDGIIGTLIEQSPNKNSRVSLAQETDAFGMRRANLEWHASALDLKTIRVIGLELAKEFALSNYGRIQLAPYILNQDQRIPLGFHCHHMGTTRMSKTPEYGVVDGNCKVFGIDNLYISGSSVFSTSGGTNPTFTIVELALRLAHHLS